MRYLYIGLIMGLLSLLSVNCYATNFTVFMNVGFGGDKFLNAGNDEDLAAGDVINLGGAVDIDLAENSFVRVGFSFREGSADFSDASEEISAEQLDVVYLKEFETVVAGGGITYHMSPQYQIDIDGYGSFEQNFDDAFGFTGHLGWRINNMELGMRLDIIDYDANGVLIVDKASTSANALAFYVAYRFK